MTQTACIFNIQKYSLHDGPGIRTVVFFKGCPLRCYWCSNPESQCGKPEKMLDNQTTSLTTVGEYKSIDEIVEEVMKDKVFYDESGGGITLSGGEVLYHVEFATQLLRQLKEKGINTASETTGCITNETAFKKFIEQVDMLYFDVKHYDDTVHRKGTGFPLQPILQNLAYALKNHPNIIVRIPVIPNFNDGIKNAQAFAELFKRMDIKKVELLPFHQFGEKKYALLERDYALKDIPQLHSEDLDYFKRIFEQSGITCKVN